MQSTNTSCQSNGVTRSEYSYSNPEASHTQKYLWPIVEKGLLVQSQTLSDSRRIFDLGCGNGAFVSRLETLGFEATGVDPSVSGITQGKNASPAMNIHVGSAYDDLAATYGTFPFVVSLEVVEHVYAPRDYARSLFNLVKPGGVAVVSTPYHGYLKNLALAVTGKLDRHFTALWDHGHIKFWSVKTLTELLTEVGFVDITFTFAGRWRPLAKSMVATATRPR